MNSPLRTLTINAGSSSMHIDTDEARRLHEPAGRQVTRPAGLIIVFLVLESRGA